MLHNLMLRRQKLLKETWFSFIILGNKFVFWLFWKVRIVNILGGSSSQLTCTLCNVVQIINQPWSLYHLTMVQAGCNKLHILNLQSILLLLFVAKFWVYNDGGRFCNRHSFIHFKAPKICCYKSRCKWVFKQKGVGKPFHIKSDQYLGSNASFRKKSPIW